MIATPSKSQEIVNCVVEARPTPLVEREYVYLTIETDSGKIVHLCLCGAESVDDMIDKLIAVRNRAWPFPLYRVQP